MNHPHPGMHSACQCLLLRLGEAKKMAAVEFPRGPISPGTERDWYVTSHGQTMAIIRDPQPFVMGTAVGEPGYELDEKQHEEQIGWSFAISTTEVTLDQFRIFWPDFCKEVARPNSEHTPIDRLRFEAIMNYCNALSEAEGIPEDQWCYASQEGGGHDAASNFLARIGYRLPSEREWEYACRAGTTTTRHDGYGAQFLGSYAWYADNADQRSRSVGLLLPNDLGLFDVYGNACEFCQDQYNPDPKAEPDFGSAGRYTFRVMRGGSAASKSHELGSARRSGPLQDSSLPNFGFRICRTYRSEE